VSHFGNLVRKLRMDKGVTLEYVARRIGSHKGYVSGIENDNVNPPSVKYIKRFAKVFGQDARTLARLAWVDKAPEILREDAEGFLAWIEQKGLPPSPSSSGHPPSGKPTSASKPSRPSEG